MTNFDPAKHRIVAVVTDKQDVDYGQHFHLDLPDLVQEIREVEAAPPPPAPERAADDDAVEFLTRQLAKQREQIAALNDRVQTVEARPHLSERDINDLSKALNTRVKDLVSKETNPLKQELSGLVARLEEIAQAEKTADVGSSVAVSITEQDVTDLATELADMTGTIMGMLSLLQSEIQDIKRRVNKQETSLMDFQDELHGWVRQQRMSA